MHIKYLKYVNKNVKNAKKYNNKNNFSKVKAMGLFFIKKALVCMYVCKPTSCLSFLIRYFSFHHEKGSSPSCLRKLLKKFINYWKIVKHNNIKMSVYTINMSMYTLYKHFVISFVFV